MKKRDVISEIAEVRTRRGDTTHLFNHFNERYQKLLTSIHVLKSLPHGEAKDELHKYIPVAIVACLEQYFRTWIARLIDSGQPFITRSRRYDRISFAHDSIVALQEKRMTVGEFIAHQIPLSSLEDINTGLNVLLFEESDGKSFLGEIKEHAIEVKPPKRNPLILKCNGDTFAALKEVYRLRHIFCHEIASNETVSSDVIHQQYRQILIFASCTETFLLQKSGKV